MQIVFLLWTIRTNITHKHHASQPVLHSHLTIPHGWLLITDSTVLLNKWLFMLLTHTWNITFCYSSPWESCTTYPALYQYCHPFNLHDRGIIKINKLLITSVFFNALHIFSLTSPFSWWIGLFLMLVCRIRISHQEEKSDINHFWELED